MLLIITPEAFAAPLKELQEHKTRTGLPTRVVTLESIYSKGFAGDEAEQVKRCIVNHYRDSLCRFVMLVGDADIFPVRYTSTDRADPKAHDTAFYPTDLYFAALHRPDNSFDTWDNNHNGYYGELRGESGTGPINVDDVSLVPAVAIGRVPASTVDEVERYVEKCIGYETHACHANWTARTLLVASHDWNQRDWASGIQMTAAESYLAQYSTTLVITRGRSRGDRFAANAITAAMNSGVGLVGYVGHGHSSGLGIPTGLWGVGDIPSLTNTDRWPIVVAAACNTGEFTVLAPYAGYVDVRGVPHQGTTKGEVFAARPPQPACIQNWIDPDEDLATHLTVRTSAGAVVYFGGVTGMQFHEPVDLLLHALVQSTTVGDAWRDMIGRYYQLPGMPTSVAQPDWGAVARFHQPWKYMLFGDPSLRIHGVGSQEEGVKVVVTMAA